MVEPNDCDNLNQVFRFVSFLTKKIWKFGIVLGNALKDNK